MRAFSLALATRPTYPTRFDMVAPQPFLLTGSIERVQFRGRWKSMESVRTYVQTARALLAAQAVPPALNQLGAQLADSLVPVMLHLLASVPGAPLRLGKRVSFAA